MSSRPLEENPIAAGFFIAPPAPSSFAAYEGPLPMNTTHRVVGVTASGGRVGFHFDRAGYLVGRDYILGDEAWETHAGDFARFGDTMLPTRMQGDGWVVKWGSCQIDPPGFEPISEPPRRRVSGRVRREGVPVANAAVFLEVQGRIGRTSTTTLQDGTFAFVAVPVGEPKVWAVQGADAGPNYAAGRNYSSLGDVDDVRIELTPGGFLHVRAVDAEGHVAARVRLWICDQAERDGGWVQGVVDVVRPRPCGLAASIDGRVRGTGWVSIVPGPNAATLTLRPHFEIGGQVVYADGAPADVGVQLEREDEPVRYSSTSGDGRFVFTDLAKGDYRLRLIGGYSFDVKAPSRGRRFVLGGLTSLSGSAWLPSGAPAGFGLVTATSTNTRNSAIVRPDGSFSIHGLRPGTYELSTDFPGETHLQDSRPIRVDSAGVKDALIRFEGSESLRGVVLDSAGRPVSGSRVEVALPFLRSSPYVRQGLIATFLNLGGARLEFEQ